MVQHRIKLINTDNDISHWDDIQDNGQHCTPVNPIIENGPPEKIAAHLLQEFKQTPDSLKPRFKQMLLDWLSSTNEATYEFEKNEKIRDLIYEMF